MPSAIPCPHGQLWFRLASDYTILECCQSQYSAPLAANIGHNLWESFPGSEEVFASVYEEAWDCGMASRVVRYGGDIVSVHAFREPDSLLVTAHTVTVEGLAETLEGMLEDVIAPKRRARLKLVV